MICWQLLLGEDRSGEGVFRHGSRFIAEIITQYDGPVLHVVTESAVSIELVPDGSGRRGGTRVSQDAAELFGFGLGPDNVKAKHRNAIFIEQRVHDGGNPCSVPRPVTELSQALFVDVEDDNPVVDTRDRRLPNPLVIELLLQPTQSRYRQKVGRVENEDRKQSSHSDQQPPLTPPSSQGG